MDEQPKQNGGKREGAGRKPDRGVRKQPITLSVTPELREYITRVEGEASNLVEDTVRKTKGFRDWLKREL